MTVSKKHAEWIAVVLFVAIVGLVFQQAGTSMASQGIASGGPYNNAAAFPKMLAIGLAIMTALQTVTQIAAVRNSRTDGRIALRKLVRPAAIVFIFALYLGGLGLLGYHVATPLMLAVQMYLCGIRQPLAILLPALLISVSLSYVFEAWLKIVLPGGFLHLNILW